MTIVLRVRVAHQIEGRTRLAAPPGVATAALHECARQLTASGLARVEVRPASGSLVVHHAGPWPQLAPALAAAGLEVAPPRPFDAIGLANSGIARLNGALSQASAGRLDLTNAAFLGLIAAGLLQLARGQTLAPASSLLNQALTLAVLHGKSTGR